MRKGYYRKKFLGFIPYEYGWCTLYTGRGYLQGIGFDVLMKVFKIFGFQFVIDIEVSEEMEWFEKLKGKLNDQSIL